MNMNMDHVGIVVSDLDSAIKFWVDILDFKVVERFDRSGKDIDRLQGIPSVDFHVVKMLDSSGAVVELLHYRGTSGAAEKQRLCDCGIRHLAFSVDDVRAYYDLLVQNGCEVISEPVEDQPFLIFFVRDPDGNLIEFMGKNG